MMDEAGPTEEGEIGLREALVSAPETSESLEAESSSSCMLVLPVSPVLVLLVELLTSPSGTPAAVDAPAAAPALLELDEVVRASASFGRFLLPDRKREMERNSRFWVPWPCGRLACDGEASVAISLLCGVAGSVSSPVGCCQGVGR